ncbi:hypothetical protein PV326_012535, partial [Microctonus aethiopoides]
MEQRRKYFGDCSSRHQRRLIRQNINSIFNTNASAATRDLSIFDTRENRSDENVVNININNIEFNKANNCMEETIEIIENIQSDEVDVNALHENSNHRNLAEDLECEDDSLDENNLNGEISSDEESVDYLLEDELREWARRN